LVAAALTLAPAAHAAKDCAAFTAKIVSKGSTIAKYKAGSDLKVPAASMPAGSVLKVRGTYVSYDVALDDFAVRNYTLTGASAKHQIVFESTPLFTTKTPDVGTLDGDMKLRIDTNGSMLIKRGTGPSAKIQSKDCDQGGIFQLEPSVTSTQVNALAPGFRYCYQAGAGAPLFFTDDVVLGYDSPQTATLLSGGVGGSSATWQVTGGGRIGGVLGDDAVQQLLTQSGSETAGGLCPHQTPVDN